MKKWLTALFLTVLMLAAASNALAAEAADITDDCKFKTSSSEFKYTQMTDRKFTTYWKTGKVKEPYIRMTAPKGQQIGSVYVCFGEMPESWEVQTSDNGWTWSTAAQGPSFLHAYVTLPEPSRYVRIVVTGKEKVELYVNEIFALGEGEKPEWVQAWQPTPEKADLMFIATHPGDEWLFFGGALPTYAVEQQRDVVMAYLTSVNGTRSSELLNGLWSMGVRTYPVIGDFSDRANKSLEDAYAYAGIGYEDEGRNRVNEWLVGLYRQYRPEVVVTHDINGEQGHAMHKMVSDAAYNALALAANEVEFTDLAATHGVWQVKKLYRHLWEENQITVDWSVPLASMDGATGIELADRAYKLYHLTQEATGYSVGETGATYDNRLFGLVHSTVGEDVNKNDFLENIDLSSKPEKEAVEVTEKQSAHDGLLPKLDSRGFLPKGEFIYSSETEGLWIFIDQTCKVIIERKHDASQPLTWFEAEIWTDVEAGEMPRTFWSDDNKKADGRANAAETAKKEGVVFAANGDYFTYRVDMSAAGRSMGVVVRDGEILYDDPYPTATKYFPNLDMMAFFEDGSTKVYSSYEITAQELVDMGAYDVYSFGPYLMKDGELVQQLSEAEDSKNPRCALGMVEPGHYVYIMAEGRLKRSSGITINHLAQLMRAKGCDNVLNLDGGQTAVIVFMGKQLNQIGAYDGGSTNARPTCEILGVGYSDQVGVYEVK